MTLTRRQTALLLGAASTGIMLPRRGYADMAALEAAARKEGSITWYVAQMSGEAAESMGRRFSQRYPGVQVSVIRTTGQVAYERLQQEMKNNTPHCDVFSSTDIAHYPALVTRKALARYEPLNIGELAGPYRGLGEQGLYYPTTGSLQIMLYHTGNLKPEDVPKRWTDMLDPKFKGRVGTGHPAFSGYFGQWVLAMRRQYTWSFFEKLEKNKPRIGRSGNDPTTLVNAGECVIGTGPASTVQQSKDKGNPVEIIYPDDGSILCVGPSAILANAPHPNAARLFVEWLLGPDYAQACIEWHLEPVRADAPLPAGARRVSDVKTINVSTAEITRDLPIAIEQWRDTFGN